MTAGRRVSPAQHAYLVYESDDDLARHVLPYIEDGMARGETIVAMISDRAARVLRQRLGHVADAVRWDLTGIDRCHLGRAFENIRVLFAAQAGAGVPIRLLTEGDVDTDRSRLESYLRFEAAANDVYAEYGMHWLCLYDRSRYPAEILARLAQVHPGVLTSTIVRASDAYTGADAYLRAHPGPLSPTPALTPVDTTVTDLAALAVLRRELRRLAHDDTPELELLDIELAATEALTNALQHGVAPCRVRAWWTPTALVVRVDDHGYGHTLATRGFRTARPSHPLDNLDRSMWITRQAADTVHLQTGSTGTSVEMHFPASECTTTARDNGARCPDNH